MLFGKKALFGLCIVAVACMQGCTAITDDFTSLSNWGGAEKAAAAVTTWLERGQLPLPALDAGPHQLSARSARSVKVAGVKGARTVQLWDRDVLIAEYVVVWERTPEQYRLHMATNKLHTAPLTVKGVPVVKSSDLR